MLSPLPQRPRWYSIPARVLFFTFLLTLLSFAVSLLLSILAVVIVAHLHAASPDLRIAYRNIALPVAVVAALGALILSLVMEVRHYRQSKALAGIARASQ